MQTQAQSELGMRSRRTFVPVRCRLTEWGSKQNKVVLPGVSGIKFGAPPHETGLRGAGGVASAASGRVDGIGGLCCAKESAVATVHRRH